MSRLWIKHPLAIFTANQQDATNGVVIENGQIIEQGTHDDLLALDGWYAQTYQSQQLEMKGEEDAE